MSGSRQDDDPNGVAEPPVFFEVTHGFDVADGTTVFPFLNGNDAKSGLPRGMPESFSLAIGVIGPNLASKIHVHPVVTQVTMVLDGCLDAYLGGPSMTELLTVRLQKDQAVLVRPGTFLQLSNPGVLPCWTLYVVGPAYVADVDEKNRVRYEDAVALDESWAELAALEWLPPKLRAADVTPAAREGALARVRAQQAAREAGGL